MISLAIKYLTFHGYLVITLEEQEKEPKKQPSYLADSMCHCLEEPSLEEVYREGFWDGQQVGN